MVEKLSISRPIAEEDTVVVPERPAGPGWQLKTITRVWNAEKSEGKHTVVWERAAVEA